MNIALIGASGFIGSALLREALARGHRVTALVSRPERLAPAAQLAVRKADVLDTVQLTGQLRGHDLVLSAFSGHAQPDIYGYYMRGMRSIVGAVRESGVPRLLVVGGAGSLEVAPGRKVIDDPGFPAQWRATAEGARDALEMLRAEQALDWTMLSPAAHIAPGARTGRFRLGTDQLLVDDVGESRISVEDYAVAMLDEAEQPKHLRRRFCIAY
ncbi:MAG TPA: NAD(P)-dependent oxidoreductase [Noviherbaspirillum sp.]|uniref:NAD(P)-dependent oxidoreductase n=1 Tax=Noviherbaspirillum sp. TaxID=1926288 RepID=UPI002F94CEFB